MVLARNSLLLTTSFRNVSFPVRSYGRATSSPTGVHSQVVNRAIRSERVARTCRSGHVVETDVRECVEMEGPAVGTEETISDR